MQHSASIQLSQVLGIFPGKGVKTPFVLCVLLTLFLLWSGFIAIYNKLNLKFYFPILATILSYAFVISTLVSYFSMLIQKPRLKKILHSVGIIKKLVKNQNPSNFLFSFINVGMYLYVTINAVIVKDLLPVQCMTLSFIACLIDFAYADLVFMLTESLRSLTVAVRRIKHLRKGVDKICSRHMQVVELYELLDEIFYVNNFCSNRFILFGLVFSLYINIENYAFLVEQFDGYLWVGFHTAKLIIMAHATTSFTQEEHNLATELIRQSIENADTESVNQMEQCLLQMLHVNSSTRQHTNPAVNYETIHRIIGSTAKYLFVLEQFQAKPLQSHV